MSHFEQDAAVTRVAPLRARLDSCFLTRGVVEDREYRDSESALAPLGRQTALVRVPGGAQ